VTLNTDVYSTASQSGILTLPTNLFGDFNLLAGNLTLGDLTGGSTRGGLLTSVDSEGGNNYKNYLIEDNSLNRLFSITRSNGAGGQGNNETLTSFQDLDLAVNNSDTPIVNVNASGNVGISSTTPGYKLAVNGSAFVTSLRDSGLASTFIAAGSDGTLIATGTAGINFFTNAGMNDYLTVGNNIQMGLSPIVPVVIMTGTSTPSPYVVTDSSHFPTLDGYNAFNGGTQATQWATNGVSTNFWVEVDLGSKYYSTNALVAGRSDGESPNNWLIQGSNDNSTWNTLYSQASLMTFAATTVQFTTPGYYRYYRMFANNGAGANNGMTTFVLGGNYSNYTSTTTVNINGIVGSSSYITSGNFGIGTTTPTTALQVTGTTTTTNLALTGELSDSLGIPGTSGMVLQSTGSATKWVATSSLGISGGAGTNYLTNSGANTYLNLGTNLQAPTFNATSTTGTSTFNGTLSVAGGNMTVDGSGNFNTNGTGIFGGIVGMPGAVGSNPGFHFTTNGTAASYGSSIGFGLDNSFNEVAAISNAQFHITNQTSTIWQSDSSGNTAQSGNLVVSGTGNSTIAGKLGIGTSTPSAPLSVVSGTSATGNIVTFGTSTTANTAGIDNDGHEWTSGAAPGIACTSGSGTPVLVGDDQGGYFTTGTANTSCTITFNKAYAIAPYFKGLSSTYVLGVTGTTTTTTAVITPASGSFTGIVIDYSFAYHK